MNSTSNNQQKLINLAIQVAMEGDMKNKHGCVLACKGKVITKCSNHMRGTINNQMIVSCHAEIGALHKYMRQSRQYELHGQEVI